MWRLLLREGRGREERGRQRGERKGKAEER